MATGYIFRLLLLVHITSLSLASVSISVEPESSSLEIGDTAEFICHLRVSSQYECEEQGFLIWAREGGILISNSTDVAPNFYDKYSVTLDFTRSFKYTRCQYSLILHNITKSMHGLYGCVFYPHPQYTKEIPYELDDTVNLLIKSKPAPHYPLCTATVLPNGDYGDNMRFRCESEEGHPSVALYWWYNGYMLDAILTRPKRNYMRLDYIVSRSMITKFRDSNLICTMTRQDDSDGYGLYNTCSIRTDMTVSLESKPIVVRPVQETMTTLVCLVNSSIPYDIVWYFNGRAIDPSRADDRFLVETTANLLHIRNTTSFDHECNITCEAHSIFDKASASTMLNISAGVPQELGQRSSSSTSIIAVIIAVGFLVLILVNIVLWLTTAKCKKTSTSKNYTANNNTQIPPMDTDEETTDEEDNVGRPDSAVLMMPDMSENGIRYANVSRTLSTDTTQSRVPSSVHYQSPSSLNESQDTQQPLALELSSSGSESSGSQECLKHGTYTARENSYADLRSLGAYECPRPRAEHEDSGVDVRQSYMSMDGNGDGVMEDTYEPIDMNHTDHDLEDIRPDPPTAPVPKQPKNKQGLRSSPLLPLPVTPKQDGYMDMKHGNEGKAKDNPSRQSMPEKLPEDPPVQNSVPNHVGRKAKSATLASPLSTHKALIQKFENGPDKNDNQKKLPERKENHNLNKDNFKGIKDKFIGSKENLKNGTENLKQAMFRKKVPKQSSAESPKIKKKAKKEKNSEYTDLDRTSMSSDGSGAYQQICFARTGGQIEDSGVYENIDS